MADKAYIKQIASDGSATEAAKHVITTDVTIGAAGRVGPYYPGNAKSILLVATGTAVKFQMITGVGTYRDINMSGEAFNANSTKVGGLNGGAIPGAFYLLDTSGSTNACTMYWNY